MSSFNLSLDDLAISTFVAMTPDDMGALSGGNMDMLAKTKASSTNTKFTKVADCCCSHGSFCDNET